MTYEASECESEPSCCRRRNLCSVIVGIVVVVVNVVVVVVNVLFLLLLLMLLLGPYNFIFLSCELECSVTIGPVEDQIFTVHNGMKLHEIHAFFYRQKPLTKSSGAS